jgi:hypothetical protein
VVVRERQSDPCRARFSVVSSFSPSSSFLVPDLRTVQPFSQLRYKLIVASGALPGCGRSLYHLPQLSFSHLLHYPSLPYLSPTPARPL